MAHVVIVGTGPAGAGLAHLLAHRGVDVTLLERQRDFSREFRGEVLMPSGVAALEQIGARGLLDAVPSYRPEHLAVYLNRRPVIDVALEAGFFEGHPPLAVSQPGLLEALVSQAGESGHLAFHRGASVKDLHVEDGRVVGVRARGEDGEIDVRGDLVVGTDGRASIVRRRGGLLAHHTDVPMDIVWFKIACPEDERGVRAYAGRGHLLIAYRTWDDRLQVGWVILKGTFGALRQRPVEAWMAEMAGHVDPEMAEHLRGQAGAIERPFLLDTLSDRVHRWSLPGALVLGDAAHTMSPVGGQGLNVALRDAIVAANHLAPVLRGARGDPREIDAAAVAIERERLPEIAQIQRLQAVPPRILLTRAWWGEPVRRVIARLLATDFARRRALADARRFAFGIGDVALRV